MAPGKSFCVPDAMLTFPTIFSAPGRLVARQLEYDNDLERLSARASFSPVVLFRDGLVIQDTILSLLLCSPSGARYRSDTQECSNEPDERKAAQVIWKRNATADMLRRLQT